MVLFRRTLRLAMQSWGFQLVLAVNFHLGDFYAESSARADQFVRPDSGLAAEEQRGPQCLRPMQQTAQSMRRTQKQALLPEALQQRTCQQDEPIPGDAKATSTASTLSSGISLFQRKKGVRLPRAATAPQLHYSDLAASPSRTPAAEDGDAAPCLYFPSTPTPTWSMYAPGSAPGTATSPTLTFGFEERRVSPGGGAASMGASGASFSSAAAGMGSASTSIYSTSLNASLQEPAPRERVPSAHSVAGMSTGTEGSPDDSGEVGFEQLCGRRGPSPIAPGDRINIDAAPRGDRGELRQQALGENYEAVQLEKHLYPRPAAAVVPLRLAEALGVENAASPRTGRPSFAVAAAREFCVQKKRVLDGLRGKMSVSLPLIEQRFVPLSYSCVVSILDFTALRLRDLRVISEAERVRQEDGDEDDIRLRITPYFFRDFRGEDTKFEKLPSPQLAKNFDIRLGKAGELARAVERAVSGPQSQRMKKTGVELLKARRIHDGSLQKLQRNLGGNVSFRYSLRLVDNRGRDYYFDYFACDHGD